MMRVKIGRVIPLLLCLMIPGIPAFAGSPETLLLGTGKAEITPAAGTPLSGYGHLRGKPTRGTHDPLFARAMALSRGNDTFLLLSLDLCLVDENLRRVIVKKIRYAHPELQASHIIIMATHTHSGSGAIGDRYWERFIMGKFNRAVFETLTDRAAAAALQALGNPQEVHASYARIPIDELVENRMIPELVYPHFLQVLRFENSQRQVQGLMLLMAAHPTVFPAKNKLEFSADYPGLLAARLETRFPGAGILFANGAAGDLRPHTIESEDRIEKMTVYAQTLDDTVAQAPFAPLDLSGPWTALFEKARLPRVKVRAGWFQVPSLIGNRFFPRKTSFQALRLGPLVFLTFPGELTSELGHEIEDQVRQSGLEPFLIGYANDYLGYVVPCRIYPDRSQYESRASFYGKNMDRFAVRKLLSMQSLLLTGEERRRADAPGLLERRQGLPVLWLGGTAYHEGFEEGRLMAREIHEGMDAIHAYFRSELPVPLVNRLVIRWLGNHAWKKMSPYVSYSETERIRGLADGAGVSFAAMKRIHAMPELYPALCTNSASWGDATAGGRLIAIRNLDWNRKMGVQKLAAVKYYSRPEGPDYVNIGYAGFSGILSGINEEGISVGQIGATSSDETLEGVPMPFLLRRILESSRSLEDAQIIFKRSNLTRGYNYVIADAEAREAMVVEATAHHLAFFRDEDPAEASAPYAFRLKNAVFRGDPALDPAIRNLQTASGGKPKQPGLEPPKGSAYEIRYLKHGQLIQDHYGSLTPDLAQEMAREIAPGSNLQSVVYAFPEFRVANAENDKRAADSTWHIFDFHELREIGHQKSEIRKKQPV